MEMARRVVLVVVGAVAPVLAQTIQELPLRLAVMRCLRGRLLAILQTVAGHLALRLGHLLLLRVLHIWVVVVGRVPTQTAALEQPEEVRFFLPLAAVAVGP